MRKVRGQKLGQLRVSYSDQAFIFHVRQEHDWALHVVAFCADAEFVDVHTGPTSPKNVRGVTLTRSSQQAS